MEDVLDPNRNVDQTFRVTNLALKSGQIVSGLLLREEGEVLILADSQGKEVRVPKSSVEDRSISPLSPMPANLTDQIAEDDFYRLLAFLLSKRESRAIGRRGKILLRQHRQHIRPLGNHGDLGVRPVFRQRIRQRRLDARRRLDKAGGKDIRRQSVGDDLHPCLAAHLRQLFELPLIEHEVVLAQNPLHEDLERWILAE